MTNQQSRKFPLLADHQLPSPCSPGIGTLIATEAPTVATFRSADIAVVVINGYY